MPQLLVRGLSVPQMCAISKPLIEQLADICACGTDNFIIEVIHSTAILDDQVVPSFPFIEVAWFERGATVRNRFAQIVTEHVRSLGIAEVEVAFRTYREDNYYINGAPCST
jgi:hypothetical protein